MLKENISLSQLLTLIINFQIGSAVVVGMGQSTKQDAWITVFISSFLGLGVMFFFWYMLSLLPGKHLFEIFEYCYKRPIAIVISFIYILAFLYYASRNVRDFGELIAAAILPLTPIEIISLSFCLLIGYVLYLGLEVLGRTSEILTPYIIGFVIFIFILLFFSGRIELSNLQPILGDGVKPIIKAIFPLMLMVPYGELVIFTVILSSVTNWKYSKGISLIGVAIASFILMLSMFTMIVTIGVDGIDRSSFPLLNTARYVTVGNFIERIDALVVFIMMLGIFIKATLFTYGGLKGMEYIFRIPFRYFIIPVTMLISLFSILISESFAVHITDPSHIKLLNYTHFPFQFIFPIMTFLILIWKRKRQKSATKKDVNC